GFNIIDETLGQLNQNILINGSARSGKTWLGMYLCLKLPHRKIILSFKKFQSNNRDFDIGYKWIDVSQFFPNLFADGQSFCEAFRCAFFSDLSSRGLMIDTILSKVNEVIEQEPKNFDEFFKALDRVAKSGQWDANITNIVKSKVKKLQVEGAKHGSINFRQGNIVLDLGNLPDDEVKSFVAELFLRQINRIEEQEQNTEKVYVVIDEAWHILASKQQKSIIGTMLLQGAFYIQLIIITQNYTHLDEDYRGHFGSHFCFRNTNDKDSKAIEAGYGAFVRDGVRQLPDFCYTNLRYQHGENILPYWKLNFEKLERLIQEARQTHVAEDNPQADFVSDGNNVWKDGEEKKKDETKEKENLEERAIDVLKKSEVAMYGYELGKAVGVKPKDVTTRRKILRKLLEDNKIKEWICQIRNEEVSYYYLINDGRDVCHNLMTRETKKKFGDWKIIFEASQGTGGADFVILREKDGKKIAIECETSLKKDASDLRERIEKNLADGIDTIIM
ncbi:MAG: ATP-binding protein, partial [Thaumarchaeota archaeon]|nr:ATP-binding protein [Nitrososphaerota archaeon]